MAAQKRNKENAARRLRIKAKRVICSECGKPVDERWAFGSWCGPCYGRIVHKGETLHADRVNDSGREARIELYAERAALGLPLFK